MDTKTEGCDIYVGQINKHSVVKVPHANALSGSVVICSNIWGKLSFCRSSEYSNMYRVSLHDLLLSMLDF